MRSTAKGSAAENRVARYLEERGWVVGSRRHRLGGGDLLAVKWTGGRWLVWLIEVKGTQRCWQTFGPADRQELLETARPNAQAVLAWSPNPRRIDFIPSEDWPR